MSGLIRKILVVDDAYVNRSIMKAIFKDYYDVLEAENGVEAINLLHENPDVALLLLDLVMPEMGGFTVLERMQSEGTLPNIPVVVLTEDSDIESQVRALDMGASDVVLKPFNSKVILHRVNNILARKDNERFVEESRQYVEEIQRKEEMYKQSLLDAKTGIYTRQSFCNAVRSIFAENPEKVYVIVRWDIDRFRVFNDVYGVKGGDSLLSNLGEMFRNEKSLGVVHGYLGVDHFVSLVEMIHFDIDRYMERIENYLHSCNDEFEFVARYGIYVVDDPDTDVSLMCDRALFALRSTKDGKIPERYAFYDKGMRALALEEQEIVNEINSAIEEGQIEVYYQPQMDFVKGTLRGAEALVRWNHPQKGLFAPNRFIPVLEKNGLVSKLDFYVWERVCKQVRKWLDEGITVTPISVNLSRIDVYSKNIIVYLNGLMELYDLKKEYIHLAVTEDAYNENPQQLERLVTELQENGYFVEMDDFGGGTVTLNALKDVPVNLIKLDMLFIRECTKEERGKIILESVVRLAANLRTPVAAEGVENIEQAEYLHGIGCDVMQGFLFSKPLPEEDFAAYMKNCQTEMIGITDIVRSANACCNEEIARPVDPLGGIEIVAIEETNPVVPVTEEAVVSAAEEEEAPALEGVEISEETNEQ